MCSGDDKPTNQIRILMDSLHRGIIPSDWCTYYNTETMLVTQWMHDLLTRLSQLSTLNSEWSSKSSKSNGQNNTANTVWLGGLFNPSAFIAATRQEVAVAQKCSLEDLYLSIEFKKKDEEKEEKEMKKNVYVVRDLVLEGGASIDDHGLLIPSPVMRQSLPVTTLTWNIMSEQEKMEMLNTRKKKNKKKSSDDDGETSMMIELPVYLNGDRSQMVTTFNVQCMQNTEPDMFARRGTAIIGWSI